MLVAFPAEVGTKTKIVGTPFEREWSAANDAGCQTGVVYEHHGQYKFTFGPGKGETAIYRGWMLNRHEYQRLYDAFWKHGYRLINDPDEYLYCHELPRWYPDFKTSTPETVWFTNWAIHEDEEETPPLWVGEDRLVDLVKKALGPGPYIVKDEVKSQKHAWKEACFIESPDDLDRVTYKFLSLQGPDIRNYLVFRKYQPFKQIGKHPKSGMPLAHEARFFVLKGRPILGFPYWGKDEGGADIEMPEAPPDLSMTGLVKSDFFTVDIAQLPESMGGGWIIVELGDGQVAGLPEHVEARVFYERLKERFTFSEVSP